MIIIAFVSLILLIYVLSKIYNNLKIKLVPFVLVLLIANLLMIILQTYLIYDAFSYFNDDKIYLLGQGNLFMFSLGTILGIVSIYLLLLVKKLQQDSNVQITRIIRHLSIENVSDNHSHPTV